MAVEESQGQDSKPAAQGGCRMSRLPRGDLEATTQNRKWLASTKGKFVPCRPEGSLHPWPSEGAGAPAVTVCICVAKFPGFGKGRHQADQPRPSSSSQVTVTCRPIQGKPVPCTDGAQTFPIGNFGVQGDSTLDTALPPSPQCCLPHKWQLSMTQEKGHRASPELGR